MSWKLSLLSSSLMGLLPDADNARKADRKLDDAREEMLECMAPYLEGSVSRPPVWGKVFYADDVQTLWYLRGDLMQFLSEHCGEEEAAKKLDLITVMFRGLVPNAQFASALRQRHL